MDGASKVIENDNVSICPVCDEFVDKLQPMEVHVNAHFNEESTSDFEPLSKEKINDEMLARILQEEEDLEYARQSQQGNDEFQKLQQTYGMCSSSENSEQCTSLQPSYKCSSQKNELFSFHLTSEDSQRHVPQVKKFQPCVLESLQKNLQATGPHPRYSFHFCCATDHFSNSYFDRSWGCGYRNLQMLLSALIRLDVYKNTLAKICQKVPSIPTIQMWIENAWHHGFDVQGAAQLGHKLLKRKKWIGATEIAVFLRFIGIKSIIVDFHRATESDGTHPLMYDWFKEYFSGSSHQTPVYIQHQGHSRLVVGYEEHHAKTRTPSLILFDPSSSKEQMQKLIKVKKTASSFSFLKKTPKQMKSKQYQLVYVDGLINEDEKEAHKLLTSTRIP